MLCVRAHVHSRPVSVTLAILRSPVGAVTGHPCSRAPSYYLPIRTRTATTPVFHGMRTWHDPNRNLHYSDSPAHVAAIKISRFHANAIPSSLRRPPNRLQALPINIRLGIMLWQSRC
ncbi:hypothetical protein FPV67DRAFT_107607 [Lyophyllum atratum]|nr:hypothetical protein FPV67DRAFT_107607 [Lyophyllum atratum]